MSLGDARKLIANSPPSLISCIRLTTWRAPKSNLAPTALELALSLPIVEAGTAAASASRSAVVRAVLAVVDANATSGVSLRNGFAEMSSASWN